MRREAERTTELTVEELFGDCGVISPPVIVDTPTGSSSSGIRGQAAEHGGVMRSPSVHPDARSFAPFKLTRPTPFISVVFPCLNEEASVGRCVDEAKGALAQAGLMGEILVVDNQSSDNSVPRAMEHGARVIVEPQPGYGSALRAGIESALGDVVVMADADLTYELTAIPKLLAPILDGSADLVLGERLTEANRSTMPLLHRYVGTPVLSYLVRRASMGVPIRDSQSGFRAFRREQLLTLGLTSTGMEFASEMLIRAGRAGFRVVETPTEYHERVGESKLNTISDGLRHLRQIFLLAPHLMLVSPGALLLAVGLALQASSLISPTGLTLGSLRWQPVFLSGIVLVLGAQTLVAGLVLAQCSRILCGEASGVRARWLRLCLPTGLVIGLVGALIDLALLLHNILGSSPLGRGEALASLAQSLLIDGISLTGFALLYPMVAHVMEARTPRADRFMAPRPFHNPVDECKHLSERKNDVRPALASELQELTAELTQPSDLQVAVGPLSLGAESLKEAFRPEFGATFASPQVVEVAEEMCSPYAVS